MKKFLIIQTAFIGDVVLATALAEKLHQHFPTAQIDFMLRKGNEGLFQNHPYLKNVWVWNKKNNKYRNLFQLLKSIRSQKYTHVINLQRFAATGFLTVFSGAEETIGFDKNPFGYWFSKKIKHVISTSAHPLHETERNQQLITHLTNHQVAKPALYPSEKDFETILPFKESPYLVIAPASIWFTKRFPINKWIDFVNKVPENLKIFIIGAPNDFSIGESIKMSTNNPNVINLCGKFSFLESIALQKFAVMNYVNDSAPMHFASAVNAPVTAIYCSTIPEFGFGPLSDNRFIVQSTLDLKCKPCGLHGKKDCPQGHFNCAVSIDTKQLLDGLGTDVPNELKVSYTENEISVFKKISIVSETVGVSSFLIGGFVRDKLLKRPTKDVDIVCTGDGIKMAYAVAELFHPRPRVSIFKTYGTAHIGLSNFDIEFVGARKESYRTESRNPEVEPGTIEDDQLRRDFTINAMAISLNSKDFGVLIDPFNGINDLKNKIIRTPLAPGQTFSDDPLRMLRAIRFATQLGFSIEPTTFQGIKEHVARIKIISQERITDELNKIILSPKPSIGFELLYTSGLLKHIFPQMVDLAGAEYIDGMGHKDNFYHTLQVLDNISAHTNDLWLRWAAILHDIAKPVTKRFEEGHGWTFHGHEAVGGRMVPKIFSRFKLPMNERMRFVQKLVELHLRPISLTKENISDSALRRLLFDAGEDLESLMMLCEADITSKNKQKVKRFLDNFEMVRLRLKEVEEKDRIRYWQPPITGEEIMKIFEIGPSIKVGELKNAIKDAILDGEIENNYEAAYKFMCNKAQELGIQGPSALEK